MPCELVAQIIFTILEGSYQNELDSTNKNSTQEKSLLLEK
jgi:hypothetical protein